MTNSRSERGSILVLAAVLIPVFLLMCGLVIDVGNWYTHKRQLQNKADAGALAAGVEYISQMANCKTAPGATGTALSNVAKNFAGTNEATGGTKYNQTINQQSNLTVVINATSATAADWTDGGSPCFDHNAGDAISPNGGLWTDVKVRETNLGSLASGFGLDLPSVTAQARVELNQVVTLQGGLPFVNETGDQIECVWAEFVRARDNTPLTSGVTPSNPVLLTKTSQGTWSANITNLQFQNAHDDVAIRYYAGSKDGAAPCDFNTDNKSGLPHDLNAQNAVSSTWINVYDTGPAPGLNSAPKLRRFALLSNTCGGPGFLYTASTDPSATCIVSYSAEVDTGINRVRGTITVDPVQINGQTGLTASTANWDTTGTSNGLERRRARSHSGRTRREPGPGSRRTTRRRARRTSRSRISRRRASSARKCAPEACVTGRSRARP